MTDTAPQQGLAVIPREDARLVAIPGAQPLRNPKHERYCRLRSVLRPKADAYRQAGLSATTHQTAVGNASRLEARPHVAERIAYLCRQDEDVLAAKRARIEEMLWLMHESNAADLWEVVEVEKTDKKGVLILDSDGKPVMKRIQRMKMLADLPEDTQRVIESVSVDEKGRFVAKTYSKLQANVELRKLLGFGITQRDDDDALRRLSDADLIAELAALTRELGIEADLNFRFGG